MERLPLCRPHLSMNALSRRFLLLAERTSWAFGLAGVVWWGAFHIEVATKTRHDLERFAALRAATLQAHTPPDRSLWSSARVNAWRRALNEPAPAPRAGL